MLTRRSIVLCGVCGLLIGVLAARPAAAIWVAVPLEILVDEAHLIVEGTVTEVKAPGFDVPDARPQELAVVKIDSVLKALPHIAPKGIAPKGGAKPREIGILQPASGGLAVSTDLKFTVGQKAIWLVKKDPALDAYRINHPSQIQPAAETRKLTELVKARAKVSGGKAVGGLAARAELIEHKGGAATSWEVRFSLKNTSDKPITVFDYSGARPLVVDWTDPEGEKRESQHYEWLKAALLAPANKTNFTTIPPGGVHFFGPSSGGQGVFFSTVAGRNTNLVTAGKHKIAASYRSEEDGKRFGVKDAWAGTATANEVQINVAK
jgi:hypothetical protein